jgi:uncharacterized membrane protein YesL
MSFWGRIWGGGFFMAGLFGFFDYTKPGKGVEKDEPRRSRFALFWVLLQRKFWQLVQLNVMYIIFCIPIVTIGPATAGLTYVLRQFSNERPVFLFSDFWDSLRLNWKQSFVFSLIQAVFVFIMSTSMMYYFSGAQENTWMFVPFGFCVIVSVFATFASFYVYLLIVTIDLKLSAIIKNALIFSVLGFKRNFITLFFLSLVFIVIYLWWPLTIMPIALIFISLAGFIICFNSFPLVQRYAIDPYLQSVQGEKAAKKDANEGIFKDK